VGGYRFRDQEPSPLSNDATIARTGSSQVASQPTEQRPATSGRAALFKAGSGSALPQSLKKSAHASDVPPAGAFYDEYSCGVTAFLRRVGIGRTKFYELIDADEIQTFLLDGKRMVVIESWLAYVARRQAAERNGELRGRRVKSTRDSPCSR
jgi:hypothetical protein